MRFALALTAVLATLPPRSGCNGNQKDAPYQPCADRACGEPCRVCPPDDPGCVETAEIKACSAEGKCVSRVTPFACPMPDPCAGRACGSECVISLPCHFAVPACLAPQQLGHCDISGQCLPGDFGSCAPHPDCLGKACGKGCNPCGPGSVCPTLMASACDPWGRCVGDVPGLCACVGKRCSEACDPCDGLCMHPYASACDGTAHCLPVGAGVACGP